MARFGVQRVAIVDWDVHHGNGAASGRGGGLAARERGGSRRALRGTGGEARDAADAGAVLFWL